LSRAAEGGGLAGRLRRIRERIGKIHPPADYKEVWNRAADADAVDAIFTGASPEIFETSGRDDADRLRPLVHPESRVLNIGCGIGRVERYLAPHVGALWGVDISGKMIARARLRLAEFPNVRLRELAAGEFLSAFETGSFDLVFSFLVLQHLEKEDAYRYLEDACRVLEPGGRLPVQFPNLLSPEYTRDFVEGSRHWPRSAGRVRPYTEAEVRHLLTVLRFRLDALSFSAGSEGNAEIYVTATK